MFLFNLFTIIFFLIKTKGKIKIIIKKKKQNNYKLYCKIEISGEYTLQTKKKILDLI